MKKCIFPSCQPKCDLYWPDAGTETYGDMCVSLLSEDILDFFFQKIIVFLRQFDEKNSRYATIFVI